MDKVVKSKKTILLAFLAVLLCVAIAVGYSYAVWTQTVEQEGTNVLNAGCLSVDFVETEDSDINLNNEYPISDEEGIKKKAYSFKITNSCTIYAKFSLNLEKLTGSTMDDGYVKLQLNERRPQLYSAYNSVNPTLSDATSSRSLDFGGLNPGASRSYTLKLWIDYDATNDQVGSTTFMSKVVVDSVAGEATGAEYIENLLADNPTTMNNDDPDENVRYMGASPNNYVNFNDELWRIIGVFYVKSSVDGPYEKRLKIIRDESIGNYSWDSSEESINKGLGVNEWSEADLNTLLNDTYYNSGSSEYCYNDLKNTHIACDFSIKDGNKIKGLDATARGMVATVMWNTGTVDGTTKTYSNTNTKDMYTAERSDHTGKICTGGNYCNDTTVRTTKWIGRVGLMYPSDYGYATGGGTSGRDACLKKELYNWEGMSECYKDDWLLNSSQVQWTITPVPSSSTAYGVFPVNSSGYVNRNDAYGTRGVRPVVYLKSSVQIVDDGNDGSYDNPYNLSL